MAEVNLKEIYPGVYSTDEKICISEEVFGVIHKDELREKAYIKKRKRHRKSYSFDSEEEYLLIKNLYLRYFDNVEERVFENERNNRLYIAMSKLTKKQYRRIFAYYFTDLTMTEIAKTEGCSISSIAESIRTGIEKLRELLLNNIQK